MTLTSNAQLSLLKKYVILENTVKQIKPMFFLESKFYDRKESSLTKYYCIRSKKKKF